MYYKNGLWYLYGVVSFIVASNDGSCDPTYPSFYTKVPAYLDWMEKQLSALNLTQLINHSPSHKPNSICFFILILICFKFE